MKIGLDITQIQYQGTGVGVYTHNLLHYLLKTDTKDTFVLFASSLRNRQAINSLTKNYDHVEKKFYPLPNTFLELLFNQLRLIPIETLIDKIDLFHSSDWTQPPTKALKVTTIHDLSTILFPHTHHPRVIKNHQLRYKWIVKDHVHVIADSLATKNDIIKHLNLPDNQISVVYLAPSPDYPEFSRLSSKKQTKLIQATKQKHELNQYFLYVGTTEPRKNLRNTIQAFNRFNQNLKQKFQLALVGRYGWGKKLNPSKLPPEVRVLGFVDQQELPSIYAGSQGFFYPSLYEGFGFPVLEAMTCGTPVLTSKRGSLGEVAGSAAVLVDPESVSSIHNGIHRLLAQSKELITKGKIQAAQFTWRKTAQKTYSVYQNILSKA